MGQGQLIWFYLIRRLRQHFNITANRDCLARDGFFRVGW